ncbi:MAG TPA: hypothetical protein VKR83_09625 [Ktedonobacteraceae bacterium]|nr:hypothetical protein [Ktedonobacteraceae bacterium]
MALALCQAIWRKVYPHRHICGIPSDFFTDHGSNFTSKYMEQVAAECKKSRGAAEDGSKEVRNKAIFYSLGLEKTQLSR